jgi:type I restriction enzyme M protein
LDIDTKRRIDTARDILVGKLPDPKSQVEQITIALIYKFMDDMDKQSEELGGKAKFFTGEFEKYSWSKIFDPRVSGFDLVNLYSEAIQRMNHNPNIPPLFREIFKNSYLPYRDPETLKMFLKVIGEFEYDHSERLGDAYEQLLSIMGSQGDAGQFRTPRHIIDFMVEVTDPQKSETILDPACGTAGFLIFSYNHILDKNRVDSYVNLSPEERAKLVENIAGYDISPDMVRIALVNMYLHGFQNPKIYEYDTLASEDRWNEYYDIILANPPFMSPRGGVRPHKRFSIQSKRSEVLFVDYIAEHLTPHGRGAVIVPEGIIFQSGTAYKKLRKSLIENSLYAVVSLPAGVFNPYSGVKTSILFLNKNLAKKTDNILFVKINNDGYGLGAQRREIKENDLPLSLEIIQKYQQSINENTEFELNINEAKLAHLVKKEKIAESGDYNLSGDRYKETMVYSGKWDFVELKDICSLEYGKGLPKKDRIPGKYPVMGSNGISGYHNDFLIRGPAIIVGRKGSAGEVVWEDKNCFPIDTTYYIKLNDFKKADLKFLYHALKKLDLPAIKNGAGIPGLNRNDVYSKCKIPLPPLEIQEQIVNELESYQKIIDGARQVVENYKPTFKIDPEWDIKDLKDSDIEIIDGDRGKNYPKIEDFKEKDYCVFLNTKNVLKSGFNFDKVVHITKEKDSRLGKGKLRKNDIVLTTRGTIGNVAINDSNVPYEHIRINSGMLILRPNPNKFMSKYIFYLFQTEYVQNKIKKLSSGSAQPQIPIQNLKFLKIPIPDLKTQKSIILNLEKEQPIIDSNKELIKMYEQKIKDKIAEVWGD